LETTSGLALSDHLRRHADRRQGFSDSTAAWTGPHAEGLTTNRVYLGTAGGEAGLSRRKRNIFCPPSAADPWAQISDLQIWIVVGPDATELLWVLLRRLWRRAARHFMRQNGETAALRRLEQDGVHHLSRDDRHRAFDRSWGGIGRAPSLTMRSRVRGIVYRSPPQFSSRAKKRWQRSRSAFTMTRRGSCGTAKWPSSGFAWGSGCFTFGCPAIGWAGL
jgi:hypothetical protein